jgi:hypothetical protein
LAGNSLGRWRNPRGNSDKRVKPFFSKDFKLDNFQYFFKIPPELANKQLAAIPPREEIIISLNVLSGIFGSFLLSDVPKDSDLRKAIEEVVEKVATFASKSNVS